MSGLRAFLSLSALAFAGRAAGEACWATPHDSYSSSVGVLGCKINTDRVAYWPGSIDCNNICIKLSHGGRSVNLLRIDQSGGAYDISYDAWVYLQTGQSAATNPIAGGAVAMDYEEVDASECADLIYTNGAKLPLSASNSMNFLSSCLAQPNSYVAQNHVLFNICDAICSLGQDEECHLDLAVSNQPSCPHTLGLTTELTSAPVFNILYQTGKVVVAGTGKLAPAQVKTPVDVAPQGTAPDVPVPPPTQPTPSAGVFKEQYATENPPPPPPSPPSTTLSKPAAVSSIPSVDTWATQISSSTVVAPTAVILPPSPSHNASVPGVGKPSAGLPTVLDGATASGTRISPSSTGVVAVNGGNERPSIPLLTLLAGSIACFVLAAL